MPQHVLIRHVETQQLHACIPLYLKGHSYGEYVFDNSWAVLASRVGQRYYVSFSPPAEPHKIISHGGQLHTLTACACMMAH